MKTMSSQEAGRPAGAGKPRRAQAKARIPAVLSVLLGTTAAFAQAYPLANPADSQLPFFANPLDDPAGWEAAAKSWRARQEFQDSPMLQTLNAEYAFALGLTGSGARIGMIDNGVFVGHPGLKGANIIGVRTTGVYGATTRKSRAGDPFDLNGAEPPLPYAKQGHGTQSAGQIVGNRDGVGSMGFAPGATLYSARSFYLGVGDTSQDYYYNLTQIDNNIMAAAYDGLRKSGAQVILGEWQIAPNGDALAEHRAFQLDPANPTAMAMKRATDQGIVLVQAAGNYGNSQPSLPALLPYLMPSMEAHFLTVVAAQDEQGTIATYSNYCGVARFYCVAAPDTASHSTSFERGTDGKFVPTYEFFGGTSEASADASGAMALLLQRYPYLAPGAVRDVLLTTARQQGSERVNERTGWGLIDLKTAVLGPGQFLGPFRVDMPAGFKDTWSNDISDTAIRERAAAQLKAAEQWATLRATLGLGAEYAENNAVAAENQRLREIRVQENSRKYDQAVDLVSEALTTKQIYDIDASPENFETWQTAYNKMRADRLASSIYVAIRRNPTVIGLTDWVRTTLPGVLAEFDRAVQASNPLRDEFIVQDLHRQAYATYAKAGSLIKDGGGSLILTGENSYSGGTAIRGGMLQIGDGGTRGSITGDVANDGVLAFNRSDDSSYAGSVSGRGMVVKRGVGRLSVSGISSFTGETWIGAGTLALAGAGSIAGSSRVLVNAGAGFDIAGTGAGAAIKSLAGSGSVTLGGRTLTLTAAADSFSGAITGEGGLSLTGGYQNLTGTSSYTGRTDVNGGILGVDGSIATSQLTRIGATGALSGIGTVGNTVVAGALAPGHSIGTLTVKGDLTLTAGSRYLVEFAGASSDLTRVSGTAKLEGGAVAATMIGAGTISNRYTILSAGQAVTGRFAERVASTGVPAAFKPSLAYDANNAYLDFNLDFNPEGGQLAGNQRRVADALAAYLRQKGSIPALFGALTPANLAQASGELATGPHQATVKATQLFGRLLTDQNLANRAPDAGLSAIGLGAPLAYASYPSTASHPAQRAIDAVTGKGARLDPRWYVWGSGFAGSQNSAAEAGAGSGSARVSGVAAGADYRLGYRSFLGFAMAGGGSSFNIRGAGAGTSDLAQFGLYARHETGPAYLSGALTYGWQHVTAQRPGVDGQTLRTKYDSSTLSGRLEAGWRSETPWLAITPYLAGQFGREMLPAYREAGAGQFALQVASHDIDAGRVELGLRLERSLAIGDQALTLRGRAGWARDMERSDAMLAGFRALPGLDFQLGGGRQAANKALVGASAETAWSNGLSLAASFDG